MNISADLEYFIKDAFENLRLFKVPRWSQINDARQPIFRYWHNVSWKLVEGDKESENVKIGDRLEVTVKIAPIVRLDGNILVQFGKEPPVVVRQEDDTQSFITGFAAWRKIRSARSAIPAQEQIGLEITTIYECYSIYLGNHYKVIGQVNCKSVKI